MEGTMSGFRIRWFNIVNDRVASKSYGRCRFQTYKAAEDAAEHALEVNGEDEAVSYDVVDFDTLHKAKRPDIIETVPITIRLER